MFRGGPRADLASRATTQAECSVSRGTEAKAGKIKGLWLVGLSGCGRSDHLRHALRCRPLPGVAPSYGRLGQSSRATIGSRRFHPLRKAAYRSDGSMLLTMRAYSACPLPIPKCRRAVVTTLPAPPSALPLVYSDISNCQPMAVTTVVGSLDAGNLAASVR